MFEIGAFKRHLEFDAVLVPPTRCNVCCYAHFRKMATPPGYFVPGSAMFDYKFVAGEQEGVAMEEPFFRELDLGEIQVLEESNGWGERAEAFDIDADCYCALKASDFGWKSMRFWTRLIRGLLERVKGARGEKPLDVAPQSCPPASSISLSWFECCDLPELTGRRKT